MTKAQHTPGPWCIRKTTNAYGKKITQILSGNPDNAFEKCQSIAKILPVNKKANARLIAAAPELLKTLEGFTKNKDILLESCDEHFAGVAERLFDQAGAVITKAKGEA